MSNKSWSREDVVQWLKECGCEDEISSPANDNGAYGMSHNPENLYRQVSSLNGIDLAKCPQTYSKVADSVCQDPHSVLLALKPIMKQIGVGCPQSFAKALVDVFTVSQETGIIEPFSTEIV